MARKKRYAEVGKYCVACGACAEQCKLGAIAVYKGMQARVDKAKCIGCGMCSNVCPASEITIIELPLEVEQTITQAKQDIKYLF